MTDLCFAYGSNTNADDWRAFCSRRGFDPGCVEALGAAVLPDRRFAFDYRSITRGGGALNMRHRLGGYVEGVVFRVCGNEGWKALNAKEGVPNYYSAVLRTAILPGGEAAHVVVYEVNPLRRVDQC